MSYKVHIDPACFPRHQVNRKRTEWLMACRGVWLPFWLHLQPLAISGMAVACYDCGIGVVRCYQMFFFLSGINILSSLFDFHQEASGPREQFAMYGFMWCTVCRRFKLGPKLSRPSDSQRQRFGPFAESLKSDCVILHFATSLRWQLGFGVLVPAASFGILAQNGRTGVSMVAAGLVAFGWPVRADTNRYNLSAAIISLVTRIPRIMWPVRGGLPIQGRLSSASMRELPEAQGRSRAGHGEGWDMLRLDHCCHILVSFLPWSGIMAMGGRKGLVIENCMPKSGFGSTEKLSTIWPGRNFWVRSWDTLWHHNFWTTALTYWCILWCDGVTVSRDWNKNPCVSIVFHCSGRTGGFAVLWWGLCLQISLSQCAQRRAKRENLMWRADLRKLQVSWCEIVDN